MFLNFDKICKMTTIEKNIVNSLLFFLGKLSSEAKFELIEKLKKTPSKKPKTTFSGLEKSYGGWEDSRSAEEIIADINGSLRFREKDINFDL
ncbi:MAG: hypothetical protein QM564_04025 [Bergeyella sp.]